MGAEGVVPGIPLHAGTAMQEVAGAGQTEEPEPANGVADVAVELDDRIIRVGGLALDPCGWRPARNGRARAVGIDVPVPPREELEALHGVVQAGPRRIEAVPRSQDRVGVDQPAGTGESTGLVVEALDLTDRSSGIVRSRVDPHPAVGTDDRLGAERLALEAVVGRHGPNLSTGSGIGPTDRPGTQRRRCVALRESDRVEGGRDGVGRGLARGRAGVGHEGEPCEQGERNDDRYPLGGP